MGGWKGFCFLLSLAFYAMGTDGNAMPFSGLQQGRVQNSSVSAYTLTSTVFLEETDIAVCPLLEAYLTMEEPAFQEAYDANTLWEMGVFDRLLFTDRYQGTVIGGISVGDTEEAVLDRFGQPQFGTKDTFILESDEYNRFYILGYKTPEYYFAFQTDFDKSSTTRIVKSVCVRKRYPLPENKRDMLIVLAQRAPWYGNTEKTSAAWQRCFSAENKIRYTQWGRGSLTMICDYGFISSSMDFDAYGVYADFEGEIPILPEQTNPYTGEPFEPLTVYDTDYPEQMIYNIYSYIAAVKKQVDGKNGVFSSDGSIFAFEAYGNILDLQTASSLYEDANVVVHYMDQSQPDKQIYFGHYPDVLGIINNRYIVESDMFGLHVYDLDKDQLIYQEEDVFVGRSDFRINYDMGQIVDSQNQVWYAYMADEAGELTITRLLEYE